jgi:hypothetical protein
MTKLGGRMVINKYRSLYPPKAAYFSAESTFMQIMFPALQIGQVNVTGSSTFCSTLPPETWCTETIPLEVHATRDLVLATKAEQDEKKINCLDQ